MSDVLSSSVDLGRENYPKNVNKQLEYGTAGFRDNARFLPHVMFRMGLLAALRSKYKKGETIGVMVTASHNPEEDNGVKLCDPMGEMMEAKWEMLATEVANAENDGLLKVLQDLCYAENIDLQIPAKVFLAMDTRPSSNSLSHAVTLGLKSLQANIKDFGLLTTPMLHYMVYSDTTNVDTTPEAYYLKLSSAFIRLNSGKKYNFYDPNVLVDCANGVGAHALKQLQPFLKNKLNLLFFNCGENTLNDKCGADFVKIHQTTPIGVSFDLEKRFASLDGDADRLIYFYLDQDSKFHMLDGDKISALVARFLKNLVEKAGLDLRIAVIQTAYANGSSTSYMQDVLKIPVICVPTGVKYLHHEAKKYDIGIYFEANGHGTVVFSTNTKQQIKFVLSNVNAEETQKNACHILIDVIDLINETVGDAISDLLLVETILSQSDWGIADWDMLYIDLPCQQLKVKIPDRRVITTTDAARKCLTPVGLQEFIDNETFKIRNSRAFVRPSGTEDIVRVYAEADTKELADDLAQKIALKVEELAR